MHSSPERRRSSSYRGTIITLKGNSTHNGKSELHLVEPNSHGHQSYMKRELILGTMLRIYTLVYTMHMYPSTRMLAHSRAPHIFSYTYPSDMTCSPPPGKVHRTFRTAPTTLFPISPRTAVQLYYRRRRLQPAVYTPVLLHQPYCSCSTAAPAVL